MTEEEKARIRAAQAAYQREWRRKNPEKHKQYVQNWWAKKAREMEVKKDEQYQDPTGGMPDGRGAQNL